MAEIGVSNDKQASVSVESLSWLGAQWMRWTGDPEYERQQIAFAKLARTFGITRYMISDSDTYGRYGDVNDPDVREKCITDLANMFAGYVDYHTPINEPDGKEYESSTMANGVVNHILWYTRQQWAASVKIGGIGGVSGQLSAYDGIETQWIQFFDDHLYAKFAPEDNPEPDFSLEIAIDQRVGRGKPFVVGEIGLSSIRDWGARADTPVAQSTQASYLRKVMGYIQRRSDVLAGMWFCAHPYDGFGLWMPDGTFKPAGQEFLKLMDTGGNPPPPPSPPLSGHFQLGFEKWHDLEPELIGDAVVDEYNVWPGTVQTQKTTNGVLIWVAGQGHAFIGDNLKVHRWQEDWSQSEEL